MNSYELTTLKKGLMILDLLRDKRFLTMNEIMEELSLNKTSVYRMLYTLEKMNYILKQDKYYYLNSTIFHDTRIKSYNKSKWLSLFTPYYLAHHTGTDVYIGILDQYELIIKNVIKSPYKEPFYDAIGKRTPIYSSAIGKAVLAHLPLQKQHEIFKHLVLTTLTKNTFIDRDLFLSHLAIIKKQGYAVDDEETNLGKRCIAAPVWLDGEVIGSIAIHGNVEQVKRNSIRSLSNEVVRFSEKLTHELEVLKE
ncbi:IclR family transcriptional regulator [Priestia aryabhattai]|uniref:IclR family transcriptional regulator n=1 Tax=Priestia aryabhattai TaxID=412384 RepID=UPI003D2D48D2